MFERKFDGGNSTAGSCMENSISCRMNGLVGGRL